MGKKWVGFFFVSCRFFMVLPVGCKGSKQKERQRNQFFFVLPEIHVRNPYVNDKMTVMLIRL